MKGLAIGRICDLTSVLLAALLCSLDLCAQTPGGPIQWNFPYTSSGVFECVEVFPRPGIDAGVPGPVTTTAPMLRASGLSGFSDPLTSDPNDDREYFVSCRSDGIFVIDATPDRFANPTSDPGIPVGNRASFILEPASVPPVQHPNFLALNGLLPPFFTIPYSPELSDPSATPPVTFPYTSRHTTNREAVVYRTAAGQFWLYSVNTARDGMWVVPLVYASGVTPSTLVPDPASAGPNVNEFGTWYAAVTVPAVGTQPPYPTRVLGSCHAIYLDQVRGAIYVVDDHNRAVYCFDCASNPSNPTVGGGILVYDAQANNGGTPHDAQPFGDYLCVTALNDRLTGEGCWVYPLPLPSNANNPACSRIYRPTGARIAAHSTYLDVSTPAIQPTLWIMSEDSQDADGRFGMAIHDFHGNVSGTYGERLDVNWIEPSGIGTSHYQTLGNEFPICSPGHHLRGVGRTGFVAHYHDGLSLVDLSSDPREDLDGWYRLQSLGTFDTSIGVHPWWGGPAGPGLGWHGAWYFVDDFSGTWDCYPYTDSGLVYASLGCTYENDSFQRQILTGGVLRVRQGHINRYWHATPFPSGAQGAGMFPRAASQYGPPKVGQPYDLRDESADAYPTWDPVAGSQLQYRWTLCYSTQGPGPGAANPAAGNAAPSWSPDPPIAAGGWSQNPHPSPTPLWFNLQPHAAGNIALPTNYVAVRNAVGISSFHFSALPSGRFYGQILVEQLRKGPNPATTGNWSASRGFWFGVVN